MKNVRFELMTTDAVEFFPPWDHLKTLHGYGLLEQVPDIGYGEISPKFSWRLGSDERNQKLLKDQDDWSDGR